MTLEKLASLSPAFMEQGTVTAGNSCGLNDVAGALLIMSSKKAEELGYPIRGWITSEGWSGVEPERMGIGPLILGWVYGRACPLDCSTAPGVFVP